LIILTFAAFQRSDHRAIESLILFAARGFCIRDSSVHTHGCAFEGILLFAPVLIFTRTHPLYALDSRHCATALFGFSGVPAIFTDASSLSCATFERMHKWTKQFIHFHTTHLGLMYL
jgi:hypothetical protein